MTALAGQVTNRILAADRLITHVADYMTTAANAVGKTKPQFTVDGGTTGPYTRNADTWLPGIEWSCVPVRIDYGSGNISTLYRGCLVTSRHFLSVNHAGVQAGNTVYFLGNDDVVYSRTISSQNTSLSSDDVRVNLLSSALPASVVPAQMLPGNADEWMTTSDFTTGFPCVFLEQELKIVAHRWNGYSTSTVASLPNETVSPMATYAEVLVGGDSASPCFIIVNGDPILVSMASTPTTGPALHKIRSGIDSAITSLGGGQEATSVDLSGFPKGQNE